MQSEQRRGQNPAENAYAIAAAAGLLMLALHRSLGNSPSSTVKLLDPSFLGRTLLWSWPELFFCFGVLAKRRWARDLGAATAALELARSLAAFPRFALLDLGTYLSRPGSGPFQAFLVLRHALGQQALVTAICACTLYALTRPALIARLQADREQARWTDGLSFAALVLLAGQIAAANVGLIEAFQLAQDMPTVQDLAHIPDWTATEVLSLVTLALASFAVFALVGLWKRALWGWLALLVQSLFFLWQSTEGALSKAVTAQDAFRGEAAGALPMAAEAFSRDLPELAITACTLAALLASRREFR